MPPTISLEKISYTKLKSETMKARIFLYRLIVFSILQTFFISLNAQTLNLVPNPSFEDSLGCPADVGCGAIYQVVDWYNIDITPCPYPPPYTYAASSPDYFNPCGQGGQWAQTTPTNYFGTQSGYNGSHSYAGIFTFNKSFDYHNYREYIGTTLPDILKPNKQYILKMYVSLADQVIYASDGIGMNLSSTLLNINNNGYGYPHVWTCLDYLTPQMITTAPITDKNNWTPITTTITATGGEKYIIIGCFKNDATIDTVPLSPSGVDFSYYYVDQVSITPINFASPDVSVCPGSCTTLNADIGNFNITYQWSSNPAGFTSTSSTPTVCPTVQTTYTVTATDAYGGTSTDAVIVSIKAAPPKPIFTGYFNTCHGNTNYNVTNYSSTYSYYYTIGLNGTHHSFSNGGSFYVNWTGSGGGVLYVNSTNNTTGCTSRDSLKVFECCNVTHGSLLPRYQDTTFTAAPSPMEFVVNGILTINGTFSFNAKHIFFGPNAKIIVNPSRTLTISNSTLAVADCDTMWDGIYLNYANSGLIVNSNSNIRDAKNAIVSNACAVYTISNSTLNKNYRNIVVQSCSGMNNSTIIGSTLTCITSPSDPFYPQYPPIAATRTYSGIEISNVSSITVGNTASAANRNHFNNLDFGIKNYVSTLTVNNNTFSNMTATGVPSFPPTSGVGIISTSDKSYQKSLTIGGPTGSINTNRFEYCYQGIYADYFQNITIQRDTFLSTGQWTSIFLYEHPSKTIKVLNNVITDGLAGITFIDCQNTTTDINSNNISNCFYGITAQNVNPDGVQKLNIYTNTINNYTYGNGIWVTNILGVQGSQTQIALLASNVIWINNPNLTMPSNGILVENCSYAFMQQNNVAKLSGLISDPTSALNLNGINVHLSPNSVLCQNTLNRMGCGIRLRGTMPLSILKLNNMSNYYYGVRLDTANISTQGDATYAWANYWTPTTSGNFRIQGTASVTTNWHYTGLLLSSNPYCPLPNNVTPPLNLVNKSSNISSCAIPVQLPLSLQYNPIVNNSYNYILAPDENRYWDKQYFYNDMQNSPSLLSSLSLSNSSYQSFYNAIDVSNIGQFARVNALMNTQDYSNAEIYNTSIVPQNNIEQNRKAVNTIYLNTWAKRRFEFTSNEHADLEAIALQSPILGGDAVFSARVMLGITPPSSTSVKRMNQNTTTAINSVGSIYPNPTKDMAYLDYSLTEGQTAYLYFYNTMGTPVKSFTLNSQSNHFEFSTKDFKTGLYFYRIVLNNNQLLESNKLIIIK